MRCVKTYSSSCSQTVSLSPAILLQFILRVCTAAKHHKNQFALEMCLAARNHQKINKNPI